MRVPPGQAGRQWLRGRLEIAEHGLSLLETKLSMLEQERNRLALRAAAARTDWEAACLRARVWQLRAALLGGQRSIRMAAAARPAGVTVHWATTAGVRYPIDAECQLPQDRTDAIAGSAVIVHARTAHRAAIVAAARHAAVTTAVRAVERECTATRIRAQGLRRRHIPSLRGELARVELTLEEQERAEGIRLRRAIQAATDSAPVLRLRR